MITITENIILRDDQRELGFSAKITKDKVELRYFDDHFIDFELNEPNLLKEAQRECDKYYVADVKGDELWEL
jgi:hypothetical protein